MAPPLRELSSPTLVLPATNIDTDQIIPARFLTTTSKTGLGLHAFTDYRRDNQGAPISDCALNDPRAGECEILVAGDNFGCGSSREHAPWALLDMGIRAVISTRFADIFRNNAHKNGLLAMELNVVDHQRLCESPWQTVRINLDTQLLTMPDGHSVVFQMEHFARHCLLNGIDELGYLLSQMDAIEAYEKRMPRS